MMKKTLKWLGLALLLVCLLTGCGRNTEQEEALMQEQWAAYLIARNEASEIKYWAYDAIEAYADSNSWEDLVHARAAVRTAMIMLEQVEVPEFALTDEVYQTLLDAGIEADAVRIEGDTLKANLSQDIGQMKGLLAQLYNDVYYKSCLEYLGELVRLDRENLDIDLLTHAYETNYLLLQMEDHSLWDRMPEICPSISAQCDEWRTDSRELEEETMKALDRMEKGQEEYAEFLGSSEYTLFLVEEALENLNLENLLPELNEIQGMPGKFILPKWTDDELPFPYYFHQGEETVILKPGQSYDPGSGFCFAKNPGVELEAIEDYISKLEYYEIEYQGRWNETEDEYSLMVLDGDCTMLITWTEAETSIFLPAPAADLMPELVYMAQLHMDDLP